MTPTEGQTKDSTGKVVGGVGIGIGALVGIGVCCILVAVMTIVILALLGPAIGNVFSDITAGI